MTHIDLQERQTDDGQKRRYFIVKFDYDPATVGLIKLIVGKRWDPADKSWLIPATYDNLKSLHAIFDTAQITEAVQQFETPQEINAARQIDDYKFLTAPYDHQRSGFNYFRSLDAGLVAWEMGTGKTKLAVDVMSWRAINHLVKKILVCVPKTIMDNWRNEIIKHSPFPTAPVLLTGSRKRKIRLLCGKQLWTIAGYDSIATLEAEAMTAGFDAVICDESLKIKNPQARRSKAVHKLATIIRYRLAMSGTPITQNPIDIFSQYKFINPAIFGTSLIAFRSRYLVMGGYGNYQVKGIKNASDLTANIYRCCVRKLKTECLDLPPQVYETRNITMDPAQAKIYDNMAQQMIAEFEGQIITAPIILTKLLRLQQITSGFVQNGHGPTPLNANPKLDELMDVIDEIKEQGNHKIIVWCRFIEEINQVCARLRQAGIGHGMLRGDVAGKDRQAIIDQFNTDPGVKVFVGQIQTGGLGIELTAADYAVFFSNTYSFSNRVQAESRCHRSGSEIHDKITYIDLVCPGTIDELILSAIHRKGDIAAEIMADVKILLREVEQDEKE
jgi:SNF2 family DNA or RNA helicase